MKKVRRTSALSLAIIGGIGLIAGRIIRPVIEAGGGIAPTIGWATSLSLLLGAAILGALAWNTFQSLHRRHERMTSDHGIKMLALAKASAFVGAFIAGGYFGYALGFADAYETSLGEQRVIRSIASGAASVAVMIAALLLERACHVPGIDDDDENNGTADADTSPA